MSSSPGKSVLGAVLIAAILSLVVNLVRLYGEVQGWAPDVFSREAGGGSSPLGISWLVIPFGFWFGRRLAQNGYRPASIGKTLGLSLLGMAVFVGSAYLAFTQIDDWRTRAIVMNSGAVAGGLVFFGGWARGWVVLAFYGVLARVPVIVIQWYALDHQWGTHFEKGPPEMPADLVPFALTLAQAALWPFGYTVLVGGLFAALGAATVKRSG